MTIEKTLKDFSSNINGLDNKEVLKRRNEFGSNQITEKKPKSFLIRLFEQITSPLLLVLLVATGIAFVLGSTTDAYIILAVVLINALISTLQEGKSEKTLRALAQKTIGYTLVIRSGETLKILSTDVVVGDIMVLSSGELVHADGRLLRSQGLKIDEAILTGESNPVSKNATKILDDKTEIHDMENMVHGGTSVTSGSGIALVTAIGDNSYMGKLSNTVAKIDTAIPLQKKLKKLSRQVIVYVFFLVVALVIIGPLFGLERIDTLLVAVSLFVSIIPEGLPVAMVLILSAGVFRMSKENVLVKRLAAVESLGNTRVLAVDKTGTLTRNELVVSSIFVNGDLINVDGVGYDTTGDFYHHNGKIDVLNNNNLQCLLSLGVLSANASLLSGKQKSTILGDPTEAAMLVVGAKAGFKKDSLLIKSPLLDEVPFDFTNKYYANLHKEEESNILIVTGAPEVVLQLCESSLGQELTSEKREQINMGIRLMQKDGLRVIALAKKNVQGEKLNESYISELDFVGLYGMLDALRSDAKESVSVVQKAGIKVVMITGDHKDTAISLASNVGIYQNGDEVLTGEELNKISTVDLDKRIASVTVFARVTPDNKLRIIESYRRRGDIVAMTGDGVNDVPSLRAADLGVAMGRAGTEIAQAAADIVLLNDNFAMIPDAVEEGRHILKSIRKVILYLFSTNLSELIVIIFAVIAGWMLPLLPAQIIWINLVTDTFLVVPLGLMKRGKSKEKNWHDKGDLITRGMFGRMLWLALIMSSVTLIMFWLYREADFAYASTMTMVTLISLQWFNVLNVRSNKQSAFGADHSILLISMLVLTFGLTLLVVYVPLFNDLIGTSALTIDDFIYAWLAGIIVLCVEEVRKLFIA